MNKFIGILFSLAVISAFIYGAHHPDSLLMTVALVWSWLLIQLGTFYAVIGMGLLYMAEKLPERQRRETLADMRSRFCKPGKYHPGKCYGWCEVAIIVMCLVLTGWTLTAFSYLLVVVMVQLVCYSISQSAGKWTAC